MKSIIINYKRIEAPEEPSDEDMTPEVVHEKYAEFYKIFGTIKNRHLCRRVAIGNNNWIDFYVHAGHTDKCVMQVRCLPFCWIIDLSDLREFMQCRISIGTLLKRATLWATEFTNLEEVIDFISSNINSRLIFQYDMYATLSLQAHDR